mgnify:CR=1 FL=1
MSLGRKNPDSRVNHVYYVNMSIHRFISRHFSIEVNFKKLLEVLRHHNQKSSSADKVKFSAVIMKAIALTYAFRDNDGTQPYRRLSGYPPMFAWQKSFQSKTIDISLMLVREFDNEKQQTLCEYLANTFFRTICRTLCRRLCGGLCVTHWHVY